MILSQPLLLVGCGKMGGAMLEGWIEMGLESDQIHIVEHHTPTLDILRNRGLKAVDSQTKLPPNLEPSVVIFAVKPQSMDEVVPAFKKYCSPHTTFLSIAAGKPIAYFENILSLKASIVRAMPNTPAAIRRGITVAVQNYNVSAPQKEVCSNLLEAIGEIAWIEDEELIDAVTALSGGGPAYVFLLTECMTQAGIDLGLPIELSSRLAQLTVSGSGELMHQSNEPPNMLRQNVTSPGGTTAEALRILMADDELQTLITKAIAAASVRSKELAS